MRWWSKTKIKSKLIIGFLIIAVLIGVIGYGSINTSQRVLTDSIGQASVMIAEETIDKVDREIYFRAEEMEAYSQDLILKEAVEESNQEFEKIADLQDYIDQQDKEWISAPQDTPSLFMQEVLQNELAEELREKIEFYKEKYGYSVFPEIYVTNKYGAVIAATGRTTDYFQADEKWYQSAVQQDNLWVGQIKYDQSSESYALELVVPLYDDGNFIGILKAILNVEGIIDILRSLEPEKDKGFGEHAAAEPGSYQTTRYKLFTPDGRLIYSTGEFKFFEDFSERLPSDILKLPIQSGHQSYFIAQGDQPGKGKNLFAHAHSGGYRDYPGLGWVLIVEHQTDEILAPVAGLRNTLLVISLVIIILALSIGLFLSKFITGPLERLTSASLELKQGNFNYQIKSESNDEIGILARTFNQMRLELKKRVAQETKDREDLLKSLLKSFTGKFGSIATILVRKNIQDLIKKNPRIRKILPPSLNKLIHEVDILSEKIRK